MVLNIFSVCWFAIQIALSAKYRSMSLPLVWVFTIVLRRTCTSSLSDLWFENIFSHSVIYVMACFFTQNYRPQLHPCWWIFIFCCCIIFHWVSCIKCIHPFYCWWTLFTLLLSQAVLLQAFLKVSPGAPVQISLRDRPWSELSGSLEMCIINFTRQC